MDCENSKNGDIISVLNMQSKLLSFNLGGHSGGVGNRAWNIRKPSLTNFLKGSKEDILCLQEVQVDNRLVLDSVLSNYDSFYGNKTILPRSRDSSHNPIYWRRDAFKKKDCGSFYLSKTPKRWSKDWDAEYVRSATWIRLLTKLNLSLFIMNIHLDNRGSDSRIKSSQLIIKRAIKYTKESVIFIAGDFNERAWQPPIEDVNDYPSPILPAYIPQGSQVYAEFMHEGFKDTYLMGGNINKLNMNSYHDYFGKKFPHVALRIDWILVMDCENRIRVVDSKILNNHPLISDHFPICTTISYK